MGSLHPPLSLLRRLGHIYDGSALRPGLLDPQPVVPEEARRADPLGFAQQASLRALGAELGVEVGAPPAEALVLVVGDHSSGKTAFVNSLVQELSLPAAAETRAASAASSSHTRRRPPVEWVRASAAPAGSIPPLLEQATREFPAWLEDSNGAGSCCSARSASSVLDGIEVVEARPLSAWAAPGAGAAAASASAEALQADVLAWLAARAAVVVCVLDSQRQPSISEGLLQWLSKLSASFEQDPQKAGSQWLQFVFAKADLVVRESDRVRLVLKASRLLTERLGRSFEILPVAAGNLTALLDGSEAAISSVFKVGNREFTLPEELGSSKISSGEQAAGAKSLQEAAVRAADAAKATAKQQLHQGLTKLGADCEAVAHALRSRLADAQIRGKAASSKLRYTLMQCAAALAIACPIVPFVLEEEDVEPWLVQACAGGLLTVAALLFGAAFLVPAPVKLGENFERQIAALMEQERYLQLLARQRAVWLGEPMPEAVPVTATGPSAKVADSSAKARQPPTVCI